MKKQQISSLVGKLGEVIVCDLFVGAWRANKRSYDIAVPTALNPRGHLGKLEIKTARPSYADDLLGWGMNPPTKWQIRGSDFLVWVCLGFNFQVRRLYAIPHGNYPRSTVHIDAKSEKKWEIYRVV